MYQVVSSQRISSFHAVLHASSVCQTEIHSYEPNEMENGRRNISHARLNSIKVIALHISLFSHVNSAMWCLRTIMVTRNAWGAINNNHRNSCACLFMGRSRRCHGAHTHRIIKQATCNVTEQLLYEHWVDISWMFRRTTAKNREFWKKRRRKMYEIGSFRCEYMCNTNAVMYSTFFISSLLICVITHHFCLLLVIIGLLFENLSECLSLAPYVKCKCVSSTLH